jgi:hypothetical protein
VDGSRQIQLIERIVQLSVSKTWVAARLEWRLESIQILDTGEENKTCLCGHTPIRELCFLRNKENNNDALVGNVCVNRFLGLESDSIFQGLKRVAKDCNKALNSAAIAFAYEKGWITDWEQKFCTNTVRTRDLSEKQATTRARINACVLAHVKTARR